MTVSQGDGRYEGTDVPMSRSFHKYQADGGQGRLGQGQHDAEEDSHGGASISADSNRPAGIPLKKLHISTRLYTFNHHIWLPLSSGLYT